MKAVLFSLLTAATLSAADQPNVILIMSDDMGYSDLGCYGGEIDTPNLDSLASGGVRFTQFYNTARCCPTRAALLTGLYPHQAGIGHMMEDKGLDAYRGELSKKAVTIAEAVKPAGYRAYMVGKWHVTKATTPKGDADKHNWPLQRGFDRFYGTIHGAGSFFDPNTLTRDNQYISPFADPEYQPEEEYYYTDAIAGHASRFIADHARDHSGNPFFMYVAFTAAHWPMHAKEKDIAKYKGRYDEGYDAIRAARVEKMRKLGLIDPHWQTAAQAGGAWNDVQSREFEIRCMEVYAAMIDSMDQGIGRMIAELKRSGQYDNTLILFFQDNGGCAESMGRKDGEDPAARASNPTLLPLAAGYLQPDMIPKQTRDGFPMRQGYGVIPGGADTYHGYGEAWANVSNTPFREYKHWVHEGGISTPLIAHWPKGIPSSRHGARRTPWSPDLRRRLHGPPAPRVLALGAASHPPRARLGAASGPPRPFLPARRPRRRVCHVGNTRANCFEPGPLRALPARICQIHSVPVRQGPPGSRTRPNAPSRGDEGVTCATPRSPPP